jgi:PAS domain S-box-containing protein
VLRHVPIQRKLTVILLLVSAAVLFLTSAAFVTYEVLTFRQATLKSLATLGRVIASNSTASLAFANEADAREILAALKAEPHIVAAALYDKKGHVFTRYPASLPDSELPRELGADGYRFEPTDVIGIEPVVTPGSPRLGTLYLKSDLEAGARALRLLAAIVTGVMAISLLVAYVVSRMLQRQISRPVLALADTAKAISAHQDYSVRAPKLGTDELGVLTDAFNHMLGRIEDQAGALRENRERLDLALRASGVGTWSWNAASNTMHWDDFVHPLFGLAPGMFSERFDDFLALVHPADRERVRREMTEALASGAPYRTEYRVIWRDGTERVLAAGGRMHRDAGVPAPQLTGVCWDITERQRLRAELQRYATELEQRVADRTRELESRNEDLRRNTTALLAANQELDAFAYSVSHDLRAPLRSIDGFSQVLLEDYGKELDAAGQDALRRVRAATQRMGTLIDDLLKLSRITRGELRTDVVDLSALARAIVTELKKTAADRPVEVAIRPGLEAQGDARLLRVALENLLGNSWKYTAKQPQARIEFTATEENGDRVFLVRDNGAGFDMKYADKLFGVFQRLHSGSEFEGTGVGLATVQRIINRHGGRIWAEAAVDKGATFYFTLSAPAPRAAEAS